MPFATLDPTIRQARLDSSTEIALVDTVGFITDLPTSLIESFKATLEESMLADVILHVHDASSPDRNAQADEVERILEDLEDMMDVDQPPTIHVWNKIDSLSDDEKAVLAGSEANNSEASVFVSSLKGEGLDELREEILKVLQKFDAVFGIELNAADGKALAWLHAHGQVLEEERDETSVSVTVRLSRRAIGQFQRHFPGNDISGIERVKS